MRAAQCAVRFGSWKEVKKNRSMAEFARCKPRCDVVGRLALARGSQRMSSQRELVERTGQASSDGGVESNAAYRQEGCYFSWWAGREHSLWRSWVLGYEELG